MDKSLTIYDTATSFYLPFDRAFSILAESNSNRLHMVNFKLLAGESFFRYEQEEKSPGEFGSDVFYTSRKSVVDSKGFPVNISIESRDAGTEKDWRGSTIQIQLKRIVEELEVCILSTDFGSSSSDWNHCRVLIKTMN